MGGTQVRCEIKDCSYYRAGNSQLDCNENLDCDSNSYKSGRCIAEHISIVEEDGLVFCDTYEVGASHASM